MDLLHEAIAERLHELAKNDSSTASTAAMRIRRRLYLGADAGKLRAQLYARDVVVGEQTTEDGWVLDVEIWEDEWAEFMPEGDYHLDKVLPLIATSNA